MKSHDHQLKASIATLKATLQNHVCLHRMSEFTTIIFFIIRAILNPI